MPLSLAIAFAVSDGAGGGGLFAERWSAYLLEHLPDKPICSSEELDGWIGDIWEPFYIRCEEKAKLLGGISLDKFYDEGAFATLVAVWKDSAGMCRWISFGDRVAFHYNYASHKLEHPKNYIRAAKAMAKIDFEKDVLGALSDCIVN